MIARRAPISRRVPLRPSQQLIPRGMKGKRTPARRKKRQSLSKQADALWSALVKVAGRCEECGSTDRLQAAHGISRRYRGTRWLLINGFCQCAACHMRYTHNPLAWTARLVVLWGEELYAELCARALRTEKPDLADEVAHLTALVRKGAAALGAGA